MLLGWALLVALTGGIDGRVAGVAIRARDVLRPLTLGLTLLAVYAAIERRAVAAAILDLPRTAARAALPVAVTAAAATTVLALHYGAFVAGGSDSYGYLSEAYGWATGHLPRPYTNPLTLPFATGDAAQTPLGYRPGRVPHTIVPSYAPGLPLLMSIGIVIAGPIGPYLVVPLSAGLFVMATYLLAKRMAGPVAGGAAALLAATSPVALFMSLWPMSDVPAAAIWTGAAAAALGPTRRSAIAAGVLTALGILVRPNLVPLAALPIAWIVLASARDERRWRASAAAVPAAAAATIVGALNAAWYGSPFTSGYGDPGRLFTIANAGYNLRHYGGWLFQSQSPWIAIACVSLLALVRPSPHRLAVALAWAMVLVTTLSYAGYHRYEQWWFIRFLLPCFGALFALVAVSLTRIVSAARRPWGGAAATALFVFLIWHGVRFAADLRMYGPFQRSEQKYADVGVFIARRLPEDAVFFAMQHSGSIRYYGGRHTVRYDLLGDVPASRASADLERLGLHPYLAIEDAEAPDVRIAFGLPADAPLPWPYVARLNRFGVSIYDLGGHPAPADVVDIETGIAPRYSAPLAVMIRPRREGS